LEQWFVGMDLFADISELNLAKTTSISFPNGKDNLLNFEITIRPDEGYYQLVHF
jgi:ubiquitin-conjugating enzyme E2 M